MPGISNIKESYITPSQILKVYNSLTENKKREAFRYLQYLKKSTFDFAMKNEVKILGQTAAGKPIEYGDSYAQDIEDISDVPDNADYALVVNRRLNGTRY